MLNNLIFLTLIIVFTSFCIYETFIHQKYKKDFEKEKLIADFAYTRIKIMRSLFINEIDINSVYFKFMLKATSYSIRTLYYYSNNICEGLEKTNVITEVLPLLSDIKLKEEFKSLNVEQKDLFVKTILNILNLYLENKYFEKLIFNMYILKFKNAISEILRIFIRWISNKQTQKKIKYIDDLNNSYNLRNYAFSY